MINLKKYLEVIKLYMNNNGLIMNYPEKPFEIIEQNGSIVGMEARRFKIGLTNSNSITYDESGHIKVDAYIIDGHSYHFEPGDDSGLHPFRIDKEKENVHCNDYDSTRVKYNKNWPDHIYFPEHTRLNITEFNLALFIATSLLYLRTNEYPVDNDYAERFNKHNNRLRRRIEQ